MGTQKNRLNGSFEYPQHMFWLRNKKINLAEVTNNICFCEVTRIPGPGTYLGAVTVIDTLHRLNDLSFLSTVGLEQNPNI